MGERLEWMEKLLDENMADDEETSSQVSTETGDNSEEEEDQTSTTYLDSNEEEESGTEEEGTFYIFKEDNPYKVAERDEENGVYQVIGNEIIMIARAEGVCCLCSGVSKILYVDNSYGGNIPAQICLPCIQTVLTEKEKTD